MPRLLIGNFEFEYALAYRSRLPSSVRRLVVELAPLMSAVADKGDYVRLPAPIEAGFFERLAAEGLPSIRPVVNPAEITEAVEASPWGWTEAVRADCARYGWRYAAPPQSVICAVNSRQFSHELEQAWGIALPRSAVAGSLDELRSAIGRLPPGVDRWVVKASFGMSARERVLGRGATLSKHASAWIEKRLRCDGAVFFEPWVERIEEAGLQYTIPASGPPVFEGLTLLLTDRWGRYCGCRFAGDIGDDLRWRPAIQTGLRVAELLKERGYFGPLGIDAMRYRDEEGRARLRPIGDINARCTMGRLALGLRRVLKPQEAASWLHVRWPTDQPSGPRRWLDEAASRLPAGSRLVRTSPLTAGGRPVRYGTLIVASPSAGDLRQVERQLLLLKRR